MHVLTQMFTWILKHENKEGSGQQRKKKKKNKKVKQELLNDFLGVH